MLLDRPFFSFFFFLFSFIYTHRREYTLIARITRAERNVSIIGFFDRVLVILSKAVMSRQPICATQLV